MRDIQTLKKRKIELGLTNQEIADISGVPLGTVQKVFSGATKSPGSRTILLIEKALYPEEQGMYAHTSSRNQTGRVCERAFEYGKVNERRLPEGGGYTYADYIALPDDMRVELIDGRFYNMAAPNSRHQIIIGQLFLQFQACVQDHPECMVLLSPLDVMLDEDDRTVVQPDLIVLCGRDKMRKGRIFGAPDLLIEVVSPGSRRMDYGKKAGKYIDAGVREYWIIDLDRRRVMVYRIEDEVDVFLFSTEDEIPVGISHGTCSIKMKDIQDMMENLGDI